MTITEAVRNYRAAQVALDAERIALYETIRKSHESMTLRQLTVATGLTKSRIVQILRGTR